LYLQHEFERGGRSEERWPVKKLCGKGQNTQDPSLPHLLALMLRSSKLEIARPEPQTRGEKYKKRDASPLPPRFTFARSKSST
jgi:hypothetical protein